MQRDPNVHVIRRIEEVIDETPTVRTLVFSDSTMHGVLPGQFAMVWVPGAGELPMSVMVRPEPGRAAFTVRRHGPASTALFGMRAGDRIGIRGPYGNSFDIRRGRLLLVGGGTGMVPLMRLLTFLKRTDNVTVLMGAKTRTEVFFEDMANRLLEGSEHEVIVATEDGSYGRPGFVTGVVEAYRTDFDAVYTCGPEPMMYKTVRTANSRGWFVQASLERVMKCGVGMCGSCCIGEELACRDGTIFDGEYLGSSREFGRVFRNKAGAAENYPQI